MKKVFNASGVIVIMAILSLLVFSCKNENETVIPLIDYLLTEELYEYTGGGTEGWRDSIAMSYNTLKQLVEMEGQYETTSLQYNAEGKLIRADIISSGANKMSSFYILFTWESDMVTARRYYGPNEPDDSKLVFVLNNLDEIIKVEKYYLMPSKLEEWFLESYLNFSWTGNNLVEVEEYTFPYTKGGRDPYLFAEKAKEQEYYLFVKWEITYDNKLNPFIKYPGLGMIYVMDMPYIFLSENNVASLIEYWYYGETTPVETYNYTVTNQYNNDDMVVDIEYYNFQDYGQGSTQTYTRTWEIHYKN
ncbi:MAG: hypothetical protein RBS37_00010 [Bacteroidales bacterium]|jgi:hypothetical protein|nr:hypothetical protein [Bacteroidales bacterium]